MMTTLGDRTLRYVDLSLLEFFDASVAVTRGELFTGGVGGLVAMAATLTNMTYEMLQVAELSLTHPRVTLHHD